MHFEVFWLKHCIQRLTDSSVGGGGSAPVNFGLRRRATGPNKSAARRNRFLCTGLSTWTAKSQSHTHTIIIMLQLFMHFSRL